MTALSPSSAQASRPPTNYVIDDPGGKATDKYASEEALLRQIARD